MNIRISFPSLNRCSQLGGTKGLNQFRYEDFTKVTTKNLN